MESLIPATYLLENEFAHGHVSGYNFFFFSQQILQPSPEVQIYLGIKMKKDISQNS